MTLAVVYPNVETLDAALGESLISLGVCTDKMKIRKAAENLRDVSAAVRVLPREDRTSQTYRVAARLAAQHNASPESLRRAAQRGLTLIELMVVIVILGILSTIVAVNVLPAGDQARIQAAQTQVDMIEGALRQYKLDMTTYPAQDQGLAALITAPQNVRNAARYRPGGYLEARNVPDDPWGNPYQYAIPGEGGAEFDVYSFGPDGRPGGNDDIGSWN